MPKYWVYVTKERTVEASDAAQAAASAGNPYPVVPERIVGVVVHELKEIPRDTVVVLPITERAPA